MSTPYVVDASVAAKWFLIEEYIDAARRLHDIRPALHVPEFFYLEFGHIVCKKHRRSEIDLDEGVRMIHDIRRIPMQRHKNEGLIATAFRYAFEVRAGLYDCLYLSLATQLECQFVTADRRFLESIADTEYAAYGLWIEDLPAA